MSLNNKVLILLCLLSCGFQASAEDLGVRGTIFDILEEPFIKMMKRKLANVDLQAEEQKMIKLAKGRINHPKSNFLNEAEEDRVFYFDPSYVLKEDIKLPCGKILHKAGVSVNPLDYMNLERRMYFIDGTLAHQVTWLKKCLANDGHKKAITSQASEQDSRLESRVILIAGSVFEVQKTLGSELQDIVFFDQEGELIKKFGIKASPAVAMQEGKLIRIEEKQLEEKK